jgi:hypothetical protein
VSALSDFSVTGPASPARTRGAGLLDFLAAAIVSMIAFPQPVARAAITGAGLPIGVFVLLLLAIIFAVYWLYVAFSVVTWGRTPGMYLLDLGLEAETKPTLGEAAGWATGWVLAALPALVGVKTAYDPERGWPARIGRVPTRSTKRESGPEA